METHKRPFPSQKKDRVIMDKSRNRRSGREKNLKTENEFKGIKVQNKFLYDRMNFMTFDLKSNRKKTHYFT